MHEAEVNSDYIRLQTPRPRLSRCLLPVFSSLPPWCPIPTAAAANYFGVHPKTLLRWHRLGIGPAPEPQDRFTCNQLFWMPAKLRAWWEANFRPPGRSVEEIIWEWMQDNPPWTYENWPFPRRPSASIRRRRARARMVSAQAVACR
jgi:hypothetical protein